MPLTEPDLWISHIRLFDSSHVTRVPLVGLPCPTAPFLKDLMEHLFACFDGREFLNSVISISVYGILRLFPLR
jgi:hypothetical protein